MFCSRWSQSDVMCSASSRAKRTSLAKQTSRTKCTSRSACGTHRSKKKSTAYAVLFFLEAPPGFEPGDKGFADPCLTTWLWRRIQNMDIIAEVLRFVKGVNQFIFCMFLEEWKSKIPNAFAFGIFGADYGARTRHLRLGKATLYQMS